MRLGLLCSSRCPGTVIVHGIDTANALRDAPISVISGFQSPVEKATLRFLLKGSVNLVVCPARSAVGMRIPAAWKKPMADGRLTIRSFVNEAASAKGGKTAKPTKGPRRPTVDLAEQRNRFVASISDAVLILHASPGGKLDRLANELFCHGRTIWTLEDAANASLIDRGARPIVADALQSVLHADASQNDRELSPRPTTRQGKP